MNEQMFSEILRLLLKIVLKFYLRYQGTEDMNQTVMNKHDKLHVLYILCLCSLVLIVKLNFDISKGAYWKGNL